MDSWITPVYCILTATTMTLRAAFIAYQSRHSARIKLKCWNHHARIVVLHFPWNHPAAPLVTTNNKYYSCGIPQKKSFSAKTTSNISNTSKKENDKNKRELRWDKSLDALRQYVEEHGDAHVPSSYNDERLCKWVERQRQQYRLFQNKENSHLTPARINQLNRLGFVWNMHRYSWDQKYLELKEFYDKNGHSLVTHLNDSPLGKWVHKQRREYQKHQANQPSNMTESRIALLEQLDFTWDVQEAIWMERYKELCEFHDNHGHCLVPKKFASNPSLARWVDNQRHYYHKHLKNTKNSLTPERIRLLENVGFAWNAHDAQWMLRREELADFMEINGLGSTPRVSQNPSLAAWIKRQRKLYQEKTKGQDVSLTEKRIASLNQLGFVWEEK